MKSTAICYLGAIAAGYPTWGNFVLNKENLQVINTLADRVASSLGLLVVETKFGQQGKQPTVAVTIYRKGERISLDDCEQMSRQLEVLLEEQTPPLTASSFLLAVQSPGIDRKLSSEREYEIFSGQQVEVKTKQKVERLGSAFTGQLIKLESGRILVDHPEKISDKKLSAKQKIKAAAEILTSIEVEVNNVISVCLTATVLDKRPSNDAQQSNN